MILLVDNYDSFTFNVVQLVGAVARGRERIEVVRNDAATVDALLTARPRGVIVSPGPGTPRDAGVSLELVRRAPVPVLGICLGHQVIAEAFGARVVHAPRTMHGRTSLVRHDARGVFAGVPMPLRVMRYHSWAVDASTLGELEPSAWADDDGTLMALRHRARPIEGVQFHPESFLTEHGAQMIANFLDRVTSASLSPAPASPPAR